MDFLVKNHLGDDKIVDIYFDNEEIYYLKSGKISIT